MVGIQIRMAARRARLILLAHRCWPGLPVALLLAAIMGHSSPASARSLGFGAYADSYGILTGSQAGGTAGTFTFTGSGTSVGSDVGVGNNEALSGNRSASISGTLYQDQAVTGSLGASNLPTISSNPATGIANAIAFSAAAGALTATNTAITSITGSTKINLSAGQNVLNIDDFSLGSSDTLTISGAANSLLIINDSGDFDISGSSVDIKLTGGITASDILFNITGTGSTVSIDGGSKKKQSDTLVGTILAPSRNIALDGYATLTGSVIGAFGTQSTAYSFTDGASTGHFDIAYMAYAPEPSSLAVLGVALGGLGFIRWRRRDGRRRWRGMT